MSGARGEPWPSIEPGTLRHPVTILAPVAGLDRSGAVVTYAMFLQTRAAYQLRSAKDAIAAGQDSPQVNVRFVMRYRAGIVAGMRLQLGWSDAAGALYQILVPTDVGGRKIRLELECLLVN